MNNKLAKFLRKEAKKHGVEYKKLKKFYQQLQREGKK